jgi:acyl carrier protein
MKTSEMIFFVGFATVSTFIVTMIARDRLRKTRTVKSLAVRSQNTDEQFARAYFPDPKQADIAIRARRVLAKNLKMPVEGLRPTDRLNDDLGAELEINPHLFWELESEFAIKCDVEDFEAFEKTLQRLVTFEDLVKFLEQKVSETPPNAPAEDEEGKPSRAYHWAIRSIPVLCITGFVLLAAGMLTKADRMTYVGTALFLSGFAVWGLANGGEFLRSIIEASRGKSWKEITAHPWSLMFLVFLTLFFLWVGGMMSWAVLKSLLSLK